MQRSHKFGPRAERHRVQVIGRLIVEKGGGERGTCLCNTLNMSLSGALVEASSPIEIGSVLNYAFSLPGMKSLIEVTGEVTRKGGPIAAAPAPGAGEDTAGLDPRETMTCYGIKFLDMKEVDRKVLKRFLAG
ncbi:MAG: PilZ domain-containing protein [Thermodesulfobacteriota bacterium]